MKQNQQMIKQNKEDISILEAKMINPYLRPRISAKKRKKLRAEESNQE